MKKPTRRELENMFYAVLTGLLAAGIFGALWIMIVGSING